MANEDRTKQQRDEVASGARHVEETEHMAASLAEPKDVAAEEREPEAGTDDEPVKTELGELTLSMFEDRQGVRVRVGNALRLSEMYEMIFETADEANSALLDAGVLTEEQVPDVTQLAGTGIAIHGVTVQQLDEAGLKRMGTSTL